jgi:uncharacterized membrane protein
MGRTMRAILVGSAVAGVVIGGMVAGVVYVTRAEPPPVTKSEPTQPLRDHIPVVRKKVSPVPEPVLPPPVAPASFDADWKAASAIIAKRRVGWRERAEKDMRLLTEDEREEVVSVLANATTQPAGMAEEDAPRLIRRGLGDAVRSISSWWAWTDPGFKEVSRAVWVPGEGADAIVDRAERWGQINEAERADVVRAVRGSVSTRDLPEDLRDAMLKAGLRRWLSR